MAQFRTSRIFDVTFVLALIGLLWFGATHKVAVNDWLFFRSYHPSSQVSQVATDAGLSPEGRRLFYRGDPQLTDQATVDTNCTVENLGCTNERGRLFIVADPAKYDQTVVTAAHEMLHLAYRRLSQAEKDRIGPLIDQAIEMNGQAVKDELSDITGIDNLRDEGHSLLGTEYTVMPTELESYYARYFTNRTLVVDAYRRSQPH